MCSFILPAIPTVYNKTNRIEGSLSDWTCIFQTYRFQFENNPSYWFCILELLAVSLGFGTTLPY